MPGIKHEIMISPLPPTAFRNDQWPRNIAAWILLVSLISLLALAIPALSGRVYVADDLGEFHLPIRAFYAQQLAAGEPFEWMPQLYGGFYIAAEGQLGAYHPFHWILYRTLPLAIAFNLELLASYPILFCGVWLLLRRLTSSQLAALYGALVFTFSSFMLLHFLHPNAIAVVAHLPWLLLAIDVALRTEVRWRQAGAEMALGLLVASQLLLGYPQCVWFSALTAGSLIIWRYSQINNPLKRIASIMAAACFGIAIGAIQWLATLHLLDNSVRKTVDIAFANIGSLHPLNLVQLLAPYLFRTRVVGQNTHELGLYIGAVPLVLCVWLLAHRQLWGHHRQLVQALIVFGAFSLLLAAGEYGGLYRLQSFIPVVNRFRFPCRAIVLVQLCMASGAGIALALLIESKGISQPNLRSRALPLVLVAAIALAITSPIILPGYVSGPLLVWLGPALLALAVVLISWAARGSQVAVFLLVLFTAIDLASYGLSYSVWHKTAKLAHYAAAAPRPPGVSSVRVVAPIDKAGPSIGGHMLLAGLTRVDGYAGLEPARQLNYSQESAWRLAGARWAYLPDPETGRRKWLAVSPTAPRARLIGTDKAEVTILRDSPGRIEVTVSTSKQGMLATTESYDAGWRATVDGREITVTRVEGDFLGCAVVAGRHLMQFEFRPPCRRSGMLISAGSLGLLLLVYGVRLFVLRPRRAISIL
jgi:hypothetical protein